MIRKLLERMSLLFPVTLTKSEFLVTVYIMSEGTAQGIPRPLQVFKRKLFYSVNMDARYACDPKHLVAVEVHEIVRYGYKHTLADGTNVTYAPNTIFKVTSEEVTEE